jgi:periplasmic protein CpxP/Spy
MANTATNKILVTLVVALLCTNLALIYYFTRRHGSADARNGSGDRQLEWIKKELQLTEAQTAQYLALRQKRDSLLRPLNEQLRESKMKMLELLRQPGPNDSLVQRVAAEITRHQQPIEREYFEHFRRVQALCTPTQRTNFDSMLVRMILRNTGGAPPSRDNNPGTRR